MSGKTVEYFGRPTLGDRPLPFSSAVRIGDLLYLSGQMGFHDDGTLPEGVEAQARRVLDNVGAVLEAAGLSLADVFHCTVMLADMTDWPAFNRVYLDYFTEPLPTRSAFGVNGLALGGLVELECQAYAGNK